MLCQTRLERIRNTGCTETLLLLGARQYGAVMRNAALSQSLVGWGAIRTTFAEFAPE